MMNLLQRKEPVIRFGGIAPAPTAGSSPAPAVGSATGAATPMRNISREARPSLPRGLTRAVLRKRAENAEGAGEACDAAGRLREALDLSPDTTAAIVSELQASDGPPLGEEAIHAAISSLFCCEPIATTTAHPLVLVGGSHPVRVRTALSLAQRLRRSDRRVALYSLQEGRFPAPKAMYSGGFDVLTVGSVDACIDAVRATEEDEMVIVEASCLDRGVERTSILPMLTLSLSAEPVYVDDGETPLPDFDFFSGIERFILSGRPTPARFGALLDVAYRGGQAFAGQTMGHGIFHPMTPTMLADRVAYSVR